MIDPDFIPALNSIVPFSYTTNLTPRTGVLFKVPEEASQDDIQHLASRLDDMLDQIAWHVATTQFELTASPPAGGSSNATLEPTSFDETLEKALEVCLINVPQEWVRSATMEVELSVSDREKADPVCLVETRLCGLDRRWKKQHAQERVGIINGLFQEYWVGQHAWLLESGVKRLSLIYNLGNARERYPHVERGLISWGREAHRAQRLGQQQAKGQTLH
ncbi:hypothetical protein ACFOW6_11350 [Fodinicurvata halophila]|uniref:Uncharacterized protein n=1 Tax=Fodinicurvata halophila TaxID=1419723 RepID=A0ABV8UN21_9PROT